MYFTKLIVIFFILNNVNFIFSNFICDNVKCYYGHFDNNDYYILKICIKTDKEYKQELYVSTPLIELFTRYDSFKNIEKNVYIQECIQINPNNKTKIYLLDDNYIIVGNIEKHIIPSLIIFAPLNFDIFSLENYYDTSYYIQTTTKSIDNIINNSSTEKDINYKRGALLKDDNERFSIDIVLCDSKDNNCIHYPDYSIGGVSLYKDKDVHVDNERSKRSKRSTKSKKSKDFKTPKKNKIKTVLPLKNGIQIASSLLAFFGICVYISNKSKSFSQSDWCNQYTIISCNILIILFIVLLTILIFLYIIKIYSICKRK